MPPSRKVQEIQEPNAKPGTTRSKENNNNAFWTSIDSAAEIYEIPFKWQCSHNCTYQETKILGLLKHIAAKHSEKWITYREKRNAPIAKTDKIQ